jgi:hypothetical protein
MTLLAIKDDFLQRTLARVPGVLGKLEYVSELRENDKYLHWGLVRIYGEEVTQRTLGDVHRELFLRVLRTPLPQLVEDAARSAAGKQVQPREFLEALVRNAKVLVPPDLGGGSVVHFNATLASLLALHP